MKILIFLFLTFIFMGCSILPPSWSERTFEISNEFSEIEVYRLENKYYMTNISNEIIISVTYKLYGEMYVINKYIVNGEAIRLGYGDKYSHVNNLIIIDIGIY